MKMMRRGCIGSAGGSIFCRRVLQGQKAETREALLVHRVDRQMCRRSQFLSGKLGSKEKRERGRRRNFEVSLMMRTAAGTMSGGASCGLTVMDGWSRRIRNRNVSDTVAKAVRRGHQGCVCVSTCAVQHSCTAPLPSGGRRPRTGKRLVAFLGMA